MAEGGLHEMDRGAARRSVLRDFSLLASSCPGAARQSREGGARGFVRSDIIGGLPLQSFGFRIEGETVAVGPERIVSLEPSLGKPVPGATHWAHEHDLAQPAKHRSASVFGAAIIPL